MSDRDEDRAEKTPRSIWKRLFVGAGLVVVLLMVLAAVEYAGQRSLAVGAVRQALAELDNAEPGWQLADIEAARRSVPDEQNSAHTILVASRLMPNEFFVHKSLASLLAAYPPQLFDADQMDMLDKEMRSRQAALTEARKLADMPVGRYAVEYPHISGVLTIAHVKIASPVIALLRFDAMNLAQKGQPKESLRSCRSIINAARSFDDEPLRLSQSHRINGVILATNAIERTLALNEPSEEDLAQMQKLAADEETHSEPLIVWRGERAVMHVKFDGLLKGTISVGELFNEDDDDVRWRVKYANWTLRDLARRDYPQFLRLSSRAVEIARLPPHEQAIPEKELWDEIQSLSRKSIILRLWLPGPSNIGKSYRDKVARLRCLIVLLASERYRRAKGAWPAKLADLTPQLLKTVPLDPFDGKELRYERLADGLVVYSVGPDLVDDGGFIHGMKRTGRATTRDVGFRLWDVQQRRQPAKPHTPK